MISPKTVSAVASAGSKPSVTAAAHRDQSARAGWSAKYQALLAQERGKRGFDTLADLVMSHDDIRLTMADIAESDVRLLMVQPWTMIGSDGNGIDSAHDSAACEHPRSMGTFPRCSDTTCASSVF